MVYFGRLLPFLFAVPPAPSSISTLNWKAIGPLTSTQLHESSAITNEPVTNKLPVTKENGSENYISTNIKKDVTTNDSRNQNVLSSPSLHETDKNPVRNIVTDMRNIYNDLSNANYHIQYSPTIRFSFVPPPSTTLSSSWNCPNQLEALELNRFITANDNDISYQNFDNHKQRKQQQEAIEHIASTHCKSKPVALYIPGLDGVGISATRQFDDLSETFEFWRMSIDSRADRSSFQELTNIAAKFVIDVGVQQGRQVVLIGESFGGLLAPAVAMRVRAMKDQRKVHIVGSENEKDKDPLKGLVLVNPATSFDETLWSTFGPLLATLRYLETEKGNPSSLEDIRTFPTPYSVVGGLTLSAVIPDSTQLRQILDIILGFEVTTVEDASEMLKLMKNGFDILGEQLPAEVIEHRLSRWLSVGTSVVNPRLKGLDVPTLVIAGEDDNMLPTKKEAERLQKIMPNCTNIVLKGSGHFVLDDRFNLTNAIINSKIDPLNKVNTIKKPYDAVRDWRLPNPQIIMETIENRVQPLRSLTSPVFFSTGMDGKRRIGLGSIPSGENGPLLFVANHQLFGLDLGMIFAQLLEDRNIVARGLAHPVIFGGDNFGNEGNDETEMMMGATDNAVTEGRGGTQSQTSMFKEFGALMVTPRNYYRLMETGQNGLLFPGGVREVFHGKNEAHQLFWPEKVDFVRIAAKFNATIVPLSAVGAADSANILVDAPDMLKLPFGLGERLSNSTKNTISARYDTDDSEELFLPPFAVPKPLPARHYFVFGKPMKTENLNYRNKDECEAFYKEVKYEVERGFEDVLRARENDPFADTLRRISYEQIFRKKAPTFQVDELNL